MKQITTNEAMLALIKLEELKQSNIIEDEIYNIMHSALLNSFDSNNDTKTTISSYVKIDMVPDNAPFVLPNQKEMEKEMLLSQFKSY